jgi:hypothetical protein
MLIEMQVADDTEGMNEGVRMLIKRIESDPQEFDEGSLNKWGRVLGGFPERYRDILTKDEIEAIEAKLKEAQRANFTSLVMRVLTGTDEYSQEQAYKEQIYQRTVAGNRGLGAQIGTSVGGLGTLVGSNGTYNTITTNSVQPKGPMP